MDEFGKIFNQDSIRTQKESEMGLAWEEQRILETGRIDRQCKSGKQMSRRSREERELNKAEQSKETEKIKMKRIC